jgi:uroporphyrinogen decarboxylase
MGQKLAAHFNVAVADLQRVLDNHFVRVDLTYPSRLSDDGKVRFDWWGAGHDTGEEGYYIPVNPLKDSKDLNTFPWPDPHDPHLLDEAAHTIKTLGDEYFIAPNFGFALFERAWSLRGFEQIFIDLGRDQDFVGALLERITAIQLILIQRFIELGVDGGYFGDDYGAQRNLLFSPVQWRKLIKPRLAQLFAPFVERGLPVIMHSDGQIQKILPDLVEIGLTTLNPAQPEVLDHKWLVENFKGKLSFYGGISTQTVLPYGSPAEVQAAVRQCAHDLAPEKTGLLIGPSHRMMTDIPLSNVGAMLAAFREL